MAIDPPTVGLREVDRLILQAMENGTTFPPGVARWQLLSWAAEALSERAIDPKAWARSGFRKITNDHFPGSTPE